MKKIKLLGILLGISCCMMAQNKAEGYRFSRVTPEEAVLLYENKPHGPQEVPVPRFALKSGNGKFIMAIGAFIQPVVGVDIGNTLGGSMYFRPASIVNVPAKQGQKADFFINPLHSGIDVQVIGFPGTKNQLVGYVNFNFTGDDNSGIAKLNAVYVKYRGLLAGYNYSLFTDAATMPSTISWCSVTGNDWSKGYQVSYSSPSFSGFSFGLSIEQPNFNEGSKIYKGKDYPDYDDNTVIGNATQPVPDIPFYLQYGWCKSSHIRVSGLVRNFCYVDKVSDKTRFVTGMGVQFSTKIQICKPLTFLGQGIYGKGIGHYINGMFGLPLSYLPDDAKPGKVKATEMMGWLAGLRCYVSKKIFLNYTFGQSRVYGVGSYWDEFKYGLDTRFSVFYNVTPYVQTAVEYLWAKQVQFSDASAKVNRLQATVRVSL